MKFLADCSQNRQSAKINSLPQFLAIRYFINSCVVVNQFAIGMSVYIGPALADTGRFHAVQWQDFVSSCDMQCLRRGWCCLTHLIIGKCLMTSLED